MKPIGPMMREHRLIERMLVLLERQSSAARDRRPLNPFIIETAIDFFRTYADRTHHGKEEEIYFRDLAQKELAEEHRRVMEELIEEHVHARRMVGSLLDATGRYARGEAEASEEIAVHLGALLDFYPAHIEKEDRHFFFPTQEYFSPKEQASMLREFEAFDAGMIHEKYSGIVNSLEGE